MHVSAAYSLLSTYAHSTTPCKLPGMHGIVNIVDRFLSIFTPDFERNGKGQKSKIRLYYSAL